MKKMRFIAALMAAILLISGCSEKNSEKFNEANSISETQRVYQMVAPGTGVWPFSGYNGDISGSITLTGEQVFEIEDALIIGEDGYLDLSEDYIEDMENTEDLVFKFDYSGTIISAIGNIYLKLDISSDEFQTGFEIYANNEKGFFKRTEDEIWQDIPDGIYELLVSATTHIFPTWDEQFNKNLSFANNTLTGHYGSKPEGVCDLRAEISNNKLSSVTASITDRETDLDMRKIKDDTEYDWMLRADINFITREITDVVNIPYEVKNHPEPTPTPTPTPMPSPTPVPEFQNGDRERNKARDGMTSAAGEEVYFNLNGKEILVTVPEGYTYKTIDEYEEEENNDFGIMIKGSNETKTITVSYRGTNIRTNDYNRLSNSYYMYFLPYSGESCMKACEPGKSYIGQLKRDTIGGVKKTILLMQDIDGYYAEIKVETDIGNVLSVNDVIDLFMVK